MGRRVGVMLDDEAWILLQEVARGERSRFIDPYRTVAMVCERNLVAADRNVVHKVVQRPDVALLRRFALEE